MASLVLLFSAIMLPQRARARRLELKMQLYPLDRES